MMKFLFLFFATFFVSHSLLLAQTTIETERCQPVDLRDRLPPVRDQGSLGWCYAHVAADLASFHTGENISPFGIVLDYDKFEGSIWKTLLHAVRRGYNMLRYKTWNLQFHQREGGSVEEALNGAAEKGLCLENELPTKGHYADLRTLLIIADSTNGRPNAKFTLAWGHGDLIVKVPCNTPSIFSSLFPTLDIDTISDILNKAGDHSFYQELFQHACPNRIRFDKRLTKIIFPSQKRFTDKAHDLLDAEEIMATTYNPSILYPPAPSKITESHTSSIVGRRWNEKSKRCELLLRNTYGTSCSQYNQDYDCEEGHLWIDMDILAKKTRKLDYFQD